MPRVLLFGAGAIGLAYAYVLHKAGVELTLVCRGNFDAVSTNGISIDSAIFGQHSFRPHGVVRTCAEAPGAWDFLVVCSKVFPGIPELIAPAVSDGTTIVLIQSGASPARSCDVGSVAKQNLDDFANLIRDGGGTINTFEDVQGQRWMTLAINATWSPLCALTLLDNTDFILSSDDSIEVAAKVTEEIISVARAKGFNEPDARTYNQQFSRSRSQVRTVGCEPSMLTDVRAGRQMEVEAILGNALSIARELKIDTPRLELLYVLCSGLNRALRLNGREAQTKTSVGMK